MEMESEIRIQKLTDTAKAMVAANKGLLAMDESYPTCNKRFAQLGIPETAELRRDYREMIVTTAGLNESISGAILFDETVHQQLKDGTSLCQVACCDNYWQRDSDASMHRSKCACIGSLCCIVPGSRNCSDCRTGSTYEWRSYNETLF